ncbi:MAG TPA: biopolymer transporter TolR [Spirochaetia bacterium]|nr:biopolymer transporter TolR [Spirochaetia bacterium]
MVSDVGTPRISGSTRYDPSEQTYTLRAGGENIWGRQDELHLAAHQVRGDFLLTAEGALLGAGVNAHRKWGVTIRATLDRGSPHADAAVHGDGLTSLQFRPRAGEETSEIKSAWGGAEIVQIERAGRTVIMRAARRGAVLQETGRIELDLPAQVLAGIFVCSHEVSVAESAVFRNVRLDVPAAPGVDGDRNPSPSRLELLDVDTGRRRIIYTSTAHFEAPNWSRDGRFLLFNQDGRIYRLALGERTPRLLDTGGVTANNNDHGISFDGRWLALSSHTAQPGRKAGSQVYVVPVDGGSPRKVTDEAPSYWHGWSPDGATLVYCAERGGNFDVWSIPAAGGPETRLTTDPGLDDGPEFSPDGAYVYFNSTRSGRMKIWRMRPDGSGQEQVSFDDYNDWFAHLSPDGKRMLYVSYLPSVPAGRHPRNERVMIREQEVATGRVRVVAHLYGGQGTMNVPSWSPDGRSVAFVSYTYGDPTA